MIVAATIVCAVLVILAVVLRKKAPQLAPYQLDKALESYKTAVGIHNAEAAVKIAIARTKDAEANHELAQIATEPDYSERLKRLVALRKRVGS